MRGSLRQGTAYSVRGSLRQEVTSLISRISIVTPSFNQARFIPHTLRSVLGQDYPDLEYLVFDGGSTDGTVEQVTPYLPRLAHWESQPDAGQADAISRGFSRSTGQIMAWLNSDDLLAPGTLHFVNDYFNRHPDIDALYSHRCLIDAANRVTGYWILPPHGNRRMLRCDMIPQETCFWRRRLWERAGNVNPQFRFAMDFELFARYMAAGRFVRVNRFLGAFRVHEHSKTSQQLGDLGKEEIHRIWATHGLRQTLWNRALGRGFRMSVSLADQVYRRWPRALPGALAGVGYDYDAVWGGRLSQASAP